MGESAENLLPADTVVGEVDRFGWPGVSLSRGELAKSTGYPGQQVTPPGRQVPECGHRSAIAGLGKRAPAERSDDIISRSKEG